MSREVPLGATALVALFITALVTAQVTASKILGFTVGLAIPLADVVPQAPGTQFVLPGAALAYAVTFFASDCYAELYGKRAAQAMVNVGFLMNFVLLLLIYSTIAAPASPAGIDPATFEQVLGASTNIVVGSLIAYLVSQNWDVLVFHRLKEVTGKDKLWLRNIASTATSQALDTVLFITVAFAAMPVLRGGSAQPFDFLLALIVGQYLLKLAIAVVDTPFVYLVTGAVRAREPGHADRILG
ncbi:queuosine precursor transporter [Natronomonas sp. EA1]|uniref:queuosine precursor transporter n=1 Tax=Natronomonas sp. EA1 TaxID=3421655 RepID=UPI003EBBFF15